MRQRLYYFKTEGDSGLMMSITEARKSSDPIIMKQVEKIIENSSNVKRIKDGFVPGYQENINIHCGGRLEYNRALKERGLVEIGYDYTPKDSTTVSNPFANDELINACRESGMELSDQEIAGLKSGEMLKDVTLDLEGKVV